MKSTPKGKHHRETGSRPWRNLATDSDRDLIIPPPILGDRSPLAMTRYEPPSMARYESGPLAEYTRPRPKPPSTLAAKARAAATKLKPTVPPVSELLSAARLAGVAANAGGAVAASVAANRFGEGHEKPLAIGLTAAGAIGTIFLGDHWQKMSQGVLGSALGQLATAYMADHASANAAKEATRRAELERALVAAAVRAATPQLSTPVAAPGARNASVPAHLYGVIDQAAADIDTFLTDARNGARFGFDDDDYQRNSYGVPFVPFVPLDVIDVDGYGFAA